jgi:hypothetical protein
MYFPYTDVELSNGAKGGEETQRTQIYGINRIMQQKGGEK